MDWGTTPEYLNDNWTEELLLLMMTKRADRIWRITNPEDGKARPAKDTWVSDKELFEKMGIVVPIVPVKK